MESHGEKDLGPCIIDHVYYIYKGCLEHLSSTRNYKQLSASKARSSIKRLHYALGTFIGKYAEVILKSETEFLSWSLHTYPTKKISYVRQSLQGPLENETNCLLCRNVYEWLEQMAQLLAAKIEMFCANWCKRQSANHQRNKNSHPNIKLTNIRRGCQLHV